MGDSNENHDDLVELSCEQTTLLERYQEITNEANKRKAIEMMQSVDWDLQQAIDKSFAGDAQYSDTVSSNTLTARSTSFAHDDDGQRDEMDEDLWFDGASEIHNGTSAIDTPVNDWGIFKGSAEWAGTSTSSANNSNKTLGTSNLRSKSGRNALSVISGTGTGEEVSGLERDSDSDGFDGHMEVEEDADDLQNANGKVEERAPLVPSEFTSIEEAMNNFTVVFEARYGYNHPPFFAGSLRDALREAFEAPGRPVSERRPLVMYLHNDNAVASNIFAKNVLCSDNVASLLNGQFITWGWDMTQEANKLMMLRWLEWNDIRDMNRILRKTSSEQYPLVLIVTKESGVFQLFEYCCGFDRPEDLMQKLIRGLDSYQRVKDVEEGEEKQRQEREMIRQEQKREYEESLARDRANQEKLERQKQVQEKEEAQRQLAEEQKADRMKKLASSLPSEPTANDANIVMVRMRFPDGLAEIRRFRRDEPLNNLAIFIESKGYDMKDYRIWNSDVPKKDLVTL
ncbi:unnamed protein product [Anisakis simplex]|uniref:FAS-associated factor 1 (inferred by orthology to a human protein) n=1 Tax=Anisakis simplex TaxID=6269 RepID=A0A0M3JRZ2_ANISI|nr:unnamed protein product [Anisakis simplex]